MTVLRDALVWRGARVWHKASLAALSVVLALPAQASSLAEVRQQLNGCLAAGQPAACPGALKALDAVQTSLPFRSSDRFCKEQVNQLQLVIKLMGIKDATPRDAQASFDATVQACSAFGL